jgi:hypothetical protein
MPLLMQWCPEYGYHGIGYVRYACASDCLAESLNGEIYAELWNAAKYNDVVQIHEDKAARLDMKAIELFFELRNKSLAYSRA